MKALIICLNRMGDIVQAAPLCKSIDAEVDVLVLRQFSDIARHIPSIKNVITVDEKGVSRELDEYDCVINLSPSPLAAKICGKVKATYRRGLYQAIDGGNVTSGIWLNHYLGVPFDKRLNLFHISDMFCLLAGVYKIADGPYMDAPDYSLETEGPLVVIHPGASSPDRIWEGWKFAQLADGLVEDGNTICLVGNETTLGADIVARMKTDRVMNLMGKTDVDTLVGLLKRANRVIGGDSAPVHIAAMLGTECFVLSLGSAFYWCTGPYGQGNVVFQGDNVSVEEVMAATRGDMIPGCEKAFSVTGDDGFHAYENLTVPRDQGVRVLAYAIRASICSLVFDRSFNIPSLCVDEQILIDMDGWLNVLLDQAIVCSRHAYNLMISKDRKNYSLLLEAENELEDIGDKNALTGYVTRLLLFTRRGLELEDLGIMAQRVSEIYNQGAALISMIKAHLLFIRGASCS